MKEQLAANDMSCLTCHNKIHDVANIDKTKQWKGPGGMTENTSRLQRKLKTAAYLLISGLAVEGITLHWAHPTSFLLFIGLGGILVWPA